MGGAFWFIATMMELSIIYCIIDFLLKSITKRIDIIVVQGIVSICFLIVGYRCFLKNYSFWGLEKVFSYYILFYIGYILKIFKISSKERKISVHIFILCSVFTALIVCNTLGSIELDKNSYINPLFFLTVSLLGWEFVYEIAWILRKLKYIKKIFVCMGQNTLGVVILHFLCFKIVNYIGVLVSGKCSGQAKL